MEKMDVATFKGSLVLELNIYIGILVVGPRLESASMTTEEVGVTRELLTVLVQIEWFFHFQLEHVKTKIYLCLPTFRASRTETGEDGY